MVKKRRRKTNKGSPYERLVCKQLSLWWTKGADDFIFWRSNTSGALSTVRARKGKATLGHCGDVACVNPIGKALTDKVTFELKRGKHRNASIQDLIDRGPAQKKPTPVEEFVHQAVLASRRAKTPYWCVIFRRDSHQSIVIIPARLKRRLGVEFFPYCEILATLRYSGHYMRVCVTTLDCFLEMVTPKMVSKL